MLLGACNIINKHIMCKFYHFHNLHICEPKRTMKLCNIISQTSARYAMIVYIYKLFVYTRPPFFDIHILMSVMYVGTQKRPPPTTTIPHATQTSSQYLYTHFQNEDISALFLSLSLCFHVSYISTKNLYSESKQVCCDEDDAISVRTTSNHSTQHRTIFFAAASTSLRG